MQFDKTSDLSKEVIFSLGKFLKSKMPSLVRVYAQFPESNMEIAYPSMTITMGEPRFTPENCPYVVAKEGFVRGSTSTVLYVWGYYDYNLQLDIWCRTKEERHRLIGEFEQAIFDDNHVVGITTTLENYYESLCRYDYEGYNNSEDSEISSQTKEWRVKIDMLAHCDAIAAKKEHLINNVAIVDDLDENISEYVIIED